MGGVRRSGRARPTGPRSRWSFGAGMASAEYDSEECALTRSHRRLVNGHARAKTTKIVGIAFRVAPIIAAIAAAISNRHTAQSPIVAKKTTAMLPPPAQPPSNGTARSPAAVAAATVHRTITGTLATASPPP